MRTLFACWFVGVLSLGLASCGPRLIDLPAVQKQMVRTAERVCEVDTDCVRIGRIDGCGCSAGGFDGVANRKNADSVRARIQQTYPGKKCLTVMNGDPACVGGRPACVEGRCVLVHRD